MQLPDGDSAIPGTTPLAESITDCSTVIHVDDIHSTDVVKGPITLPMKLQYAVAMSAPGQTHPKVDAIGR
jgi:hypothetical protein